MYIYTLHYVDLMIRWGAMRWRCDVYWCVMMWHDLIWQDMICCDVGCVRFDIDLTCYGVLYQFNFLRPFYLAYSNLTFDWSRLIMLSLFLVIVILQVLLGWHCTARLSFRGRQQHCQAKSPKTPRCKHASNLHVSRCGNQPHVRWCCMFSCPQDWWNRLQCMRGYITYTQ